MSSTTTTRCSGWPRTARSGAVAWFAADTPVRSGWAWGHDYVKGAVAVAEAEVGKGKLLLFGPLVAFRAHPHGTFKLLFNGIYYGNAEPVLLRAR